MKRALWQVVVIGLLLGAVIGGLRFCEPYVRPISEGNSADFWCAACAVELDGAGGRGLRAHTYLPREGWFIYAITGMHGEYLYRVPEAEVLATFPTVLRELEAGRFARSREDVEAGYRDWLAGGGSTSDPAGLLRSIHTARPLRSWWHESEQGRAYLRERDEHFEERWEQAKRWRWNIVGEFLFFTGLIFFAAWPWLRNSPPWRWGMHFALLPVLFCLPYWLGYACLAFTSAGSQGSVMYPAMLVELRGLPRTDLDRWIILRLPKFLADFSPYPGPMLALTFMGGVGPTAMVALGLALGVFIRDVRTALTVSPKAIFIVRFALWIEKRWGQQARGRRGTPAPIKAPSPPE